MEENWTYDDGDFNEDLPYVELQFGIDDLYMIYQSVAFKYEKWIKGGHPDEQARLAYLKDFLYRVVLEYKFKID